MYTLLPRRPATSQRRRSRRMAGPVFVYTAASVATAVELAEQRLVLELQRGGRGPACPALVDRVMQSLHRRE